MKMGFMDIKTLMRKYKFTYAIGKLYRKIEIFFKLVAFNIDAELRKCGIGHCRYKKLKAMKNSFNGERCFIVAMGPSLTIEDLRKIEHEYTFSMNSICLKCEELNWWPTFYGVQDSKVFHKFKKDILKLDVKYIFVDGTYSRENDSSTEWVYFPRNYYYNAYDAYFNHEYKVKFSSNAYACVYEGFTVTYSIIQLAVYLGFKEIYLLGCDNRYTSNHTSNHFVDSGIVDPTYKEAENRMNVGYMVAKKYADKNGICIYNATRGGYLDVFERVSLDDLELK